MFGKIFHLIFKDEDAYYLGSGIGLNFRLIRISSKFNVLKRKNVMEDYEKAKNRLFLLDYEVRKQFNAININNRELYFLRIFLDVNMIQKEIILIPKF